MMKTALVCHDGADLSQEGIARWLGSFLNLVGIVVLREKKRKTYRRIKWEVKRVGAVRFLDVLAFRIYYKFFLSRKDQIWQQKKLAELFDH